MNVSGSLVIGFLLVLLSERLIENPLWRPFLATGVLRGYTTFSTYTFEAALRIRAGTPGPALLSLVSSVLDGRVSVFVGIAVAECRFEGH